MSHTNACVYANENTRQKTLVTFGVCFRALVIHGFAVSEKGEKMSKSVGNVIDPDVVINGGKVRYDQPILESNFISQSVFSNTSFSLPGLVCLPSIWC